ncbi:Xylanolytic transcriptional activator xlnR [Vanrija pseudolonga]|uniref:Xylanolytic transcriptional activator xlnR n=1 Tax=Vanrija pseudolonga TaxID=143232 RepID=A0AAF1BJ98_9TREE|nr:Xylanolytic transcriptional activator xlnR [Vanrija pseudolonga]
MSSSGSSSTTTTTTDTARAARSPAWATATPTATATTADSPAATSAMWRVGPSTKPSTTNYTTTPSHSTSTSPLPARSPPPAQQPPYPTPPLTSATQSNGDSERGDEKPATTSAAPSAPSAPSAAASSHHDEEHDEVLDDNAAPASNSAGSPSRPGTTATSPTTTSPPALSTTTTTPTAAVPIVKPKLRASRACSSCNRQKLRCDGQNPCGRCIGLGQAKVCEYLPSLRGKTRKKKGAVSAVGGVPVPAPGAVGTTAATSANGSSGVTSPSEPHLAGSKRRRSLEGFAREYEYEYARWHALARNGVGAWGSNGASGSNSERERAERDHRDRDREQREREQAYYVAERERDARDRAAEHDREHERRQRSRANSAHSVHSAHSAHSPRSRQPPTLTPVQRLTPLPPTSGGDALSILAEASAISPVERVRDVRSGDLRERERGERRREWSPRPEVAPVSDACEAKHLLGFVNAHEAENLFNLYVRYLNPHLPVLDTSTPQGGVAIHVARRSIALFNAVCCVSARAFNVVLWDRLKAFAAGEASRLVLDRSFEAVQAQMVYATWNLPTEDGADAAYVRFGLAKRLAEDIDLPAAIASPLPSWAKRSIARTSLLLYAADATLALELGKPVLVRDVSSWAAQLDGGGVDDLLVSIFSEWAHALTRAVDSLRAQAATWSTNTSPAAGVYAAAMPDIVATHRVRFVAWRERAERRVEALHEQYPDSAEHAGLVIALARLYEGYASLVLDAYVLERALFLRRRGEGLAEFQASAIRLIELFDIDLSSSHLRGAPDTVFTVLTYAAVSLVHSVALGGRDSENKAAVLALARRASDVLARAAMTPDHLPAAQSVFLSRLIAKVGADAVSAEEASDIATLAGGQPDEAAHARALFEPTTSIWPPRPAADPKRARATLAGAEYPAPPPALPRAALGLGVGSFRRTGLAARSGLSGLGGW